MPPVYAIDQLAQRYGCPPWLITTAPPWVDADEHLSWLMRALEFQRMEASVRRGQTER